MTNKYIHFWFWLLLKFFENYLEWTLSWSLGKILFKLASSHFGVFSYLNPFQDQRGNLGVGRVVA